VIVIQRAPLRDGSSRLHEIRGPERISMLHRSAGWAQFTRRREVVCGVNKVGRANTVNFFSAFRHRNGGFTTDRFGDGEDRGGSERGG